MSGNTELLTLAADFIEKYCDQTTDCEDCKIKSLCDALSREFDPPYAIGERIRKAAEE